MHWLAGSFLPASRTPTGLVRFAIRPKVFLRKVPAAGPHHERPRDGIQVVAFSLRADEGAHAIHRIAKIRLAFHIIGPGKSFRNRAHGAGDLGSCFLNLQHGDSRRISATIGQFNSDEWSDAAGKIPGLMLSCSMRTVTPRI
jgi:hypothetical protein